MLFSKVHALLAASLTAKAVLAHTTFTEFYIDGVSNGAGTCVRMSKVAADSSAPITDLASSSMVCGFDGTTGVDRVCSAKAGSTITFEWHSWANDKTKMVLDEGHKGPCAVYMKKVDSALKDSGEGDGWFKIYDEGYVNDEWCTNKLINNGGLLSVKLPEVTSGNYLIRPELLSLHNAIDGKEPQFYTGCAQVFLESSGNLVPETTVAIPGYVEKGQPSVNWNLYYGMDPYDYVTPGPNVTDFSASGVADAKAIQSEGALPEGCILKNGNFCAFEVPEYTDETGCWAAGQNCWDQNKQCWATTPATGGQGCKELEARCTALNEACEAKNFQGPPDEGKTIYMGYSTLSATPTAETPASGLNIIGGGNANNEQAETPAIPSSVAAVETSAVVVTSAAAASSTPSIPEEEKQHTYAATPAEAFVSVGVELPAPEITLVPAYPAPVEQESEQNEDDDAIYITEHHTTTVEEIVTVYATVYA